MAIVITKTVRDLGTVTLPDGTTLPGKIHEQKDAYGEPFLCIDIMFESGWSMGFDNYSQWQCLVVDWKDRNMDDPPFFWGSGIPAHFAFDKAQQDWRELLTSLPDMIQWLKSHGTNQADRKAFYATFPY